MSNLVEEYMQAFEILVAQATGTSEDQLPGYFLCGLKSEVKCRIHTHDPRDVNRAIELAKDIEEEIRILEGVECGLSRGSSMRALFLLGRLGSKNRSKVNGGTLFLNQKSVTWGAVRREDRKVARLLP